MKFNITPQNPHEFLDQALISMGQSASLITGLDLFRCDKITDKGLLSLTTPNLESLNVRGCESLTPQGLAAFVERCPKLLSLNLGHFPQLNDDLLSALKCPNLRSFIAFDLSDCTDVGFSTFLSNTPELEELNIIKAPKLTGAFLSTLAEKCRKIKSLRLIDVPISKAEFAGCLSHVEDLDLGVAQDDIFKEGSAAIINMCPNLKKLSTNHWPEIGGSQLIDLHVNKIDDKGLCALAEQRDHLERLTVENGSQITDEGLSELLTRSCGVLESLDINLCSSVEGQAFELYDPLQLRDMSLGDCKMLSGEGVENLAEECHHLHSLHLTNCDGLTEKAFTRLTEHCYSLYYLTLSNLNNLFRFRGNPLLELAFLVLQNNNGITDDSLADLAALCPGLISVDLSYCPNITIKGVLSLVDNCPDLSRLLLWECKISEIELTMLEGKKDLEIYAYRGLKAYSASNPNFDF